MAYNKTIWSTGDTITASLANNWETQYDEAISWAQSFGLGGSAKHSSDLNTIVETGLYQVNQDSLNTPYSYGNVLHIQRSSSTATQLFSSVASGGEMYKRYKNADNWTSWQKIAMDDEVVRTDGSNDMTYNLDIVGDDAYRMTRIVNNNSDGNTYEIRLNQNSDGSKPGLLRYVNGVDEGRLYINGPNDVRMDGNQLETTTGAQSKVDDKVYHYTTDAYLETDDASVYSPKSSVTVMEVTDTSWSLFGSQYGTVITFWSDLDRGYQELVDHNNNRAYREVHPDTFPTWSAWEKIITNTGTQTFKGNVQWNGGSDDLDSLKSSVSNGKQQVETAITDKGGTVSDSDGDGVPTFQELVDGVNTLSNIGQSLAITDDNVLVNEYTERIDTAGSGYTTIYSLPANCIFVHFSDYSLANRNNTHSNISYETYFYQSSGVSNSSRAGARFYLEDANGNQIDVMYEWYWATEQAHTDQEYLGSFTVTKYPYGHIVYRHYTTSDGEVTTATTIDSGSFDLSNGAKLMTEVYNYDLGTAKAKVYGYVTTYED